MRPLRSIFIYIGFIFIAGSLMAPWLYRFVQSVAEHFTSFSNLASQPFHRYYTRTLLILAFSALWPFLRSVGIRNWRDLGLGREQGVFRELRRGFLLGLGSLAVVGGLAWITGARGLNLDHTRGEVGKHLLNAGLASLIVAVLEEVLFRGAVFGALRRVYYWLFALVISSFLFSVVHFLQHPIRADLVDWASGFRVLGSMCHGFTQPGLVMPGFLNLALVGFALGLAYQQTGTLYYSIGLHGGWIFWQKSYAFLTREGSSAAPWFWGTNKLLDGWLTFLVLWLTVFIVWREPQGEKWIS